MNGASAEPCAKAIRSPTMSIVTTSGNNHHFLRTRMNAQSSPISVDLAMTVRSYEDWVWNCLLELPFEVAATLARRACEPYRVTRGFQLVASRSAHQQRNGADDDEVDDSHEDWRRHFAEQPGHAHPTCIDL